MDTVQQWCVLDSRYLLFAHWTIIHCGIYVNMSAYQSRAVTRTNPTAGRILYGTTELPPCTWIGIEPKIWYWLKTINASPSQVIQVKSQVKNINWAADYDLKVSMTWNCSQLICFISWLLRSGWLDGIYLHVTSSYCHIFQDTCMTCMAKNQVIIHVELLRIVLMLPILPCRLSSLLQLNQ